MKNILDFCFSKINYIQHKLDMFILKSNTKIEFEIPYPLGDKGEKVKLKFVGSGSYGNVLRIKNLTSEESLIKNGDYFIMKIMKTKHDEPQRCLQINRVIKKIKKKGKKIIEMQMKLHLIDKYTTNILDVKIGKKHDVIFLEFISGYDLKDLMMYKTLNQEDIDIVFLMTLISVRIFHKILKLSHRDLKLENLYYNDKTKTVQILDYSFVCDKEDVDCFRRNQGTAKYIHPKQNKRSTQKYNILGRNNSMISMVTSPRTAKKIYNYPESFSQDLYSCLIILFKMHYQHTKKNQHLLSEYNRWVYDIVDEFNSNFKKDKNKYQEKKKRYQLKTNLFKKLLSLEDNQIFSPSFRIVINIIEKYWDFKKRDFVYQGKTGDNTASHILDELIHSLINVSNMTKESKKEPALLTTSAQKKEILEDIFKLDKVTTV